MDLLEAVNASKPNYSRPAARAQIHRWKDAGLIHYEGDPNDDSVAWISLPKEKPTSEQAPKIARKPIDELREAFAHVPRVKVESFRQHCFPRFSADDFAAILNGWQLFKWIALDGDWINPGANLNARITKEDSETFEIEGGAQ